MELGSRIRALRTARGLSQETIAERLQVSRQAVAKWESDAVLPDVVFVPASWNGEPVTRIEDYAFQEAAVRQQSGQRMLLLKQEEQEAYKNLPRKPGGDFWCA